jgi:hypothetical protein
VSEREKERERERERKEKSGPNRMAKESAGTTKQHETQSAVFIIKKIAYIFLCPPPPLH